MLTWTFEKKGTAPQYADPGMAVALRSASAATDAGLTAVKSAAETDLNGTLTTVQSGAVLSLNAAYQLQFDADSWISIFKIPVAAESNFAVFAEHFPSEFKNLMPSAMRNDHGESMSASHTAACDSDEHGHDDHDDHAETSTDCYFFFCSKAFRRIIFFDQSSLLFLWGSNYQLVDNMSYTEFTF